MRSLLVDCPSGGSWSSARAIHREDEVDLAIDDTDSVLQCQDAHAKVLGRIVIGGGVSLIDPAEWQRRDAERGLGADLPAISDPPSLRLIDREERAARNGRAARRSPGSSSGMMTTSTTLTALDRSTTPPVPAEGNDGDLLIFAAARSAWFTGHSEASANLDWTNPNDTGWRAAEKAATPEVAAETSAGLPKRVPQANLVPGSPLREERPLRIVRDAASIAAHTTGYFRGWRRGQEIGGYAIGGRPGREAAGGWDFSRDGQAEPYDNNAGYRSS